MVQQEELLGATVRKSLGGSRISDTGHIEHGAGLRHAGCPAGGVAPLFNCEKKIGEARGAQPAGKSNAAWASATLCVRHEGLSVALLRGDLVSRLEELKP